MAEIPLMGLGDIVRSFLARAEIRQEIVRFVPEAEIGGDRFSEWLVGSSGWRLAYTALNN